MITQLTGQDLPQWIAGARTAGLPGIASFAKGLEQDLNAVTLGLTTRWNSGPVEGVGVRVHVQSWVRMDVQMKAKPR